MSTPELICSANTNADTIALCTSDGVIKFYDTLTSTIKLEYASSTHLQASCTCLSWSKHKKKNATNTRKKVKKNSDNIENELIDLDLIAIGTTQGTILLYSLSKASLHSQLVDGHIDQVNDICWSPTFQDSLYSCSNDGQIIEWSITESKIKNKWKGSKSGITAIAVDPKSKYLLTASKTITLWDLESRTKIKTFTGHSNDINKLEFIDYGDNQLHFISSAVNDRIINVWQYAKDSDHNDQSTISFISFLLNDNPVYINTNRPADNDNELILNVVNGNGHLYVYKYLLKNGKQKKPIKYVNDINIETVDTNKIQLNIMCGQQLEQTNGSDANELLIAYGTFLAPKFEKLNLDELKESQVTLRREDPYKLNVSLETQVTKIETPNIAKDLKVIVPGYMAPLNNNAANSKRKSTEPSQMSLEERLNAIGINDNAGVPSKPTGSQFIPKTDNLLVLLVQGLQSNDSKTLNHVLQHKNDKVISKTVRLLPTNYILSLFKELSRRLQGHAQSGLGIIKWLKCVLMTHTSFLMSYPDLIDSLGNVYEMMNARTKLFPQLSKLQGKLQLVMSQVSAQAESINTADVNSDEALLNYQESTDEDEQIEDELIPSHSEHDDYMFSDEEDEDDEEGSDDKGEDDDDEDGSDKLYGDEEDDEEDDDEDGSDDDDEDEEAEENEKDKKLRQLNNKSQLAKRKNVIDQYLPKTNAKKNGFGDEDDSEDNENGDGEDDDDENGDDIDDTNDDYLFMDYKEDTNNNKAKKGGPVGVKKTAPVKNVVKKTGKHQRPVGKNGVNGFGDDDST